MPSNNKPVIDSNSYRVEVRAGVETAVATTIAGDEVGYYRNNQGDLVATKSHQQRAEYKSWLAFRTWSNQVLPNPVREKGWHHTTKEVAVPAEAKIVAGTQKPPAAQWRPSRLDRIDAGRHAKQIATHLLDD